MADGSTSVPLVVDTPSGPAHAYVHAAPSPRACVVLGHGAGRGTDTADLAAITAALPAEGTTVVLVDQPWVVAGGRGGKPARILDAAWVTVLGELRAGPLSGLPLVSGGRSTGARVACRTADAVAADALLLLGFPLRPPSARRDEAKLTAAVALRLDEWARAGDRPVVLVQGERDAFGTPPEVVDAVVAHGLPAPTLVPVPGADHSLVARRGVAVADLVVDAARAAVDLACAPVRPGHGRAARRRGASPGP